MTIGDAKYNEMLQKFLEANCDAYIEKYEAGYKKNKQKQIDKAKKKKGK